MRSGTLPGDLTATLPKGGRHIGVMALNTAFLQLAGGDYEGKLVWDPRQVAALCPDGVDRWQADHDLCLLLTTHHGPNWLTPAARELGDSEIAPAGRFALHLFGHMHETRIETTRRGADPLATRLYQGCSVFGMEHFGAPPQLERGHGYCAGEVRFDGDQAQLRLWPRVATKNTGRWRCIPDHANAVLGSDEATAPESVPLNRRVTTQATPETPALDEPTAPESPSQHRTPHSTLPARRPFFGRAKELARAAACLEPEHRGWGLVIDGPSGIGKTALALEAAHRAPTERFPLKLWVTAKGRELDPDGVRRLLDQPVASFDSLLAELGRAMADDAIPPLQPQRARHPGPSRPGRSPRAADHRQPGDPERCRAQARLRPAGRAAGRLPRPGDQPPLRRRPGGRAPPAGPP